MTFEEAWAAFPVLERLAYLNAGSFAPLARRGRLAHLGGAGQAQLAGDWPQRVDHEGDVLVQIDGEVLGAFVDVFPVHAGRE